MSARFASGASCWAVDLRLYDEGFVTVRAGAGGQELEMVAIAAGPVAGPRVAGVDPERQPVTRARTVRIAGGRLFLSPDLDLHGQSEFVPAETQVREVGQAVELRVVLQAGRTRAIR